MLEPTLAASAERGVTAVKVQSRDNDVLVTLPRDDGTTEVSETGWLIGVGGAHSVTRTLIAEALVGGTYPGGALVADLCVSCDLPRDGSALIVSPKGYVLPAPLPDERWLCFVGDLDNEEAAVLSPDRSLGPVSAAVGRRVGGGVQLIEVAWAAPVRMHHRRAGRFADGRRFLLGDAGHLSSPFGGEGLNSSLHDAHNLAWKLALERSGRGRPGLLETFESERLAADYHVLAVSETLHDLARGAVEWARTGIRPTPLRPTQVAALVRSRSMLDVSYPASPLVGEYHDPGVKSVPARSTGDRYPDRAALGGTYHHLILSGQTDDPGVARLRERWHGVLDGVRTVPAAPEARTPSSEANLVRPDGHIGFRATPADAAGLAALDLHVDPYLVPV